MAKKKQKAAAKKTQKKSGAKVKANSKLKAKAKLKTTKAKLKTTKAKLKTKSLSAQPKAKNSRKASKPVLAKKPAAVLSSAKKINLSHFISPLDDRVLVQVQAQERFTAGGLIIPDTAQISGNQRGIVVAVGRGHRDEKGRIRPVELRVGDLILMPEQSGESIQVAGEEVKILRESEILGIVSQ